MWHERVGAGLVGCPRRVARMSRPASTSSSAFLVVLRVVAGHRCTFRISSLEYGRRDASAMASGGRCRRGCRARPDDRRTRRPRRRRQQGHGRCCTRGSGGTPHKLRPPQTHPPQPRDPVADHAAALAALQRSLRDGMGPSDSPGGVSAASSESETDRLTGLHGSRNRNSEGGPAKCAKNLGVGARCSSSCPPTACCSAPCVTARSPAYTMIAPRPSYGRYVRSTRPRTASVSHGQRRRSERRSVATNTKRWICADDVATPGAGSCCALQPGRGHSAPTCWHRASRGSVRLPARRHRCCSSTNSRRLRSTPVRRAGA